jgi:hypothetical protein
MNTTTAPTEPHDGISYRALAMLRAIGAGRAQLTCSSEPDLFIDGVPCCDQFTAHALAHRGLVQPKHPAAVGDRVRAMLTPAGRALVVVEPAAA